jgi:hypothetical protein
MMIGNLTVYIFKRSFVQLRAETLINVHLFNVLSLYNFPESVTEEYWYLLQPNFVKFRTNKGVNSMISISVKGIIFL